MNITSIPSNTASAITPFNPLGKSTVGEEEKDSKNSSLKAVEESANSSRTALRQDSEHGNDTVDEINDDNQERQQSKDEDHRQQQHEQRQEQEEIRQLAARDREVRNHERAHAAVGGQFAGAPSYQFERGPDGVRYAVAGEVSIETAAVRNDPQATINKAQQIRRAALAPAEPSPQDRRVAAQASQLELQAREDLSAIRREALESEKVAAEEREEVRQENSASDESQRKQIQDVRPDQTLSSTNLEQNNQRLEAINRSYLNLTNQQSSRLGSIVSEAV